ncbi:MAG TPA: DUF1571 domain-containing protein [Gemmataceae bacterium]|nr:DUF1571 domain-containing protein [Gemmataceae bacterium]
MRRLLICLPLCLLMAPSGPHNAAHPPGSNLAEVIDDGSALPTQAQMKRLAETDPVAFLEACLRRYDREVKGYRCILHKQERLGGVLQPSEEIAVDFREKPFSVLMDWKEGARLAQRTLYVKGENKDKMLAKGAGLLALGGVLERDADSEDAKRSSRYAITEFGIKVGTQRTLAAWKQAVKDDALHVEFLGEVKVKEVGDRVCWKLRRTGYKSPEDIDGVTDGTFYFDAETWLQVGSTLKGADGQLLADYFFKDIELNPDFKPDTFTKEAIGR